MLKKGISIGQKQIMDIGHLPVKCWLVLVLPINDSTSTHTWTDSYPYSCISIFALHPQYADLRQLPALSDKLEADRFEVLREELNALPQIDYERVNNAKLKYLRLLFEQEGKKVLASLTPKRKVMNDLHVQPGVSDGPWEQRQKQIREARMKRQFQ